MGGEENLALQDEAFLPHLLKKKRKKGKLAKKGSEEVYGRLIRVFEGRPTHKHEDLQCSSKKRRLPIGDPRRRQRGFR